MIVSALDLRFKFGVDESEWADPARTIVTNLDKANIGFYVDEILDVISSPANGWGKLPALLPRGIFSRIWKHQDGIYLYAEFSALQHIPDNAYLQHYIQHLRAQAQFPQEEQQTKETAVPACVTAQHRINTTAPDITARVANSDLVPIDASLPGQPRRPDLATPEPKPTKPDITAAEKTEQPSKLSYRHTSNRVVAATPRHTISNAESSSTAKATPTISPQNKLSVTVSPHPPHARHAVIAARSPQPDYTHKHGATNAIQHQAARSQSVWPGVIVFLLLFGLALVAIWYIFASKNAKDTANLFGKQSTSSITIKQPNQAVHAHRNTAGRDRHRQVNIVPDDPKVATQAKPSTAISSSHVHYASGPNKVVIPSTSRPHAKIQRDRDGFTITLEIPASSMEANKSSQHKIPVVASTNTRKLPDRNIGGTTQASRHSSTAHKAKNTGVIYHTTEIIHIVVKGDTLWAIAKRYVNDPFRYPELARLSKIKNPNLIYPGERVRIIEHKASVR